MSCYVVLCRVVSRVSTTQPPTTNANQPPQHHTAASSKQAACVTALHRMLLHDGFKVMETRGPADTVDLLATITR